MADILYKIGDYIEYKSEYYNGHGGFSYIAKYGCIVSVNKYSYNIIKQYGGQIWYGVTPYCKVDEDTFISKFSIYNEYKNALLEIKDTLSEKLRNIIEDKCNKDLVRIKRSVLNYTLKHFLQNTEISPESWAIQWYVYHLLRMHEPYKIQHTLNYCYGATKELQKFMKENIDFMVNMQFLRDVYSNIMIYLIEEKILEFKYKEGKFTEEDYISKIFPKLFNTRKIKLQTYLKFRNFVSNIDINLEINYNKTKYKLVIPSEELLDSKIIFPSRYGTPNGNCSKCIKRKEFKDLLKYKSDFSGVVNNIPYTYDKKKKELLNIHTNKILKINHDSEHASVYFSKCSELLILEDKYSSDMYSKSVFTMFNLDGKMIGIFEIHYNNFDCVFAKIK